MPIPWWAWPLANFGVGKPDYTPRPSVAADAYAHKNCWTCGEIMLRSRPVFILTPTEALNQTAMTPPSHESCAEFAAQACPHYTKPPNCCCAIWMTKTFTRVRYNSGHHYALGDPVRSRLRWFRKGRSASRQEVLDCIEGGLPLLRRLANEEGGKSPALLHAKIVSLQKLLPQERVR